MTDTGGQAGNRSLAEAATLLGTSERTLRRWIAAAGGAPCRVEQPGYPPFTVERRGAGLVVQLAATERTAADSMADMSASDRQMADTATGEVAQLRALLAAAERQRDELAADKAWLQERLERAEEERAELRRMLNLEQQTLAALGQPAALTAPATPVTQPVPTDAETGEKPPGAATPTAATSAAPLRPWWRMWRRR